MNYKVLAIAMLVTVVGFAQEGAAPTAPVAKPKPVTAAEVQKARPDLDAMIAKMFVDADVNKDGVLSKEEFATSVVKRVGNRQMGGGMGQGQGGRGMGMGGGKGGQGNGPRGGMKAPPMEE